jgi:ribulose 1,5-bisphosphate carboxylase large subunit-like protein
MFGLSFVALNVSFKLKVVLTKIQIDVTKRIGLRFHKILKDFFMIKKSCGIQSRLLQKFNKSCGIQLRQL